MGSYSASEFTADAQELPDGLVDAVENDLGLTSAEYLAQAAAAADGAAVVADLKANGVDVVDSRIDGTVLAVQVRTAADAAIAEQRGARATIGDEPEGRGDFPSMRALADLLGGTGWGYSYAGFDYGCSIGLNGYNATTGAPEFVTAGHCIRGVEPGPVSPMTISQTAPGGGTFGTAIGSVLDSTFRFGDEYDSGLVAVTSAALVPKPAASWWGGGQGSPGTGRMSVSGVTSGIVGAVLCKSGITSGWTCGHILDVDALINVDGHAVNAIISDACALPGDSGGPGLTGNFALGILSAGTFDTCAQDGLAAFFPMTAPGPYGSISSQHTNWEPALALNAPVLAGPLNRTGFVGDSLTGTVPSAVLGTYVRVHVDGEATPRTANVNPTTKSWTVPLTGVAAGPHTWTAVTAHGSWSRSTVVSGNVTLVPRPTVERISGADRYEAAVGISKAGFPDTAPVVYLVSGEKFPDALSAAPAAAMEGGPLLLTTSGGLPTAVRDEIDRLDPSRIVVVGGVNSVSEDVLSTLRTLTPTPTVERYAGADRYAASRNLVDAIFDEGVEVLYISTGANFPDALSASAAAGSKSSPVLLVPGFASTLDSATLALVDDLAPDAIRIAGGVNSVSPGIQSALAGRAPSVTRLGGADRFVASQTINQDAFSTSASVYVANGFNFPDALAGAALAARNSSPLYVTPTTCLAQGLPAETGRLGSTKLILLGGPNSLTPAVEQLTGC
ncbi:cell wall-binding repeat-containing protein [Agromyces albus]|nr:cell wall-binding repeat-containing protein [Agromyces albus]